uniref:Uncharacterized protein n=1 Tax=Palpitomonas bilix TaxID=652834 RepID=A0A7S3GC05_9EUKA
MGEEKKGLTWVPVIADDMAFLDEQGRPDKELIEKMTGKGFAEQFRAFSVFGGFDKSRSKDYLDAIERVDEKVPGLAKNEIEETKAIARLQHLGTVPEMVGKGGDKGKKTSLLLRQARAHIMQHHPEDAAKAYMEALRFEHMCLQALKGLVALSNSTSASELHEFIRDRRIWSSSFAKFPRDQLPPILTRILNDDFIEKLIVEVKLPRREDTGSFLCDDMEKEVEDFCSSCLDNLKKTKEEREEEEQSSGRDRSNPMSL